MAKNNSKRLHAQTLTTQSGKINPDIACLQFVINNPTTFVVKLGTVFARTDTYEYIVKAQCMFVSPPINFSELFYFIDSYASGAIQPMVYCYPRWIGTPGVYALT